MSTPLELAREVLAEWEKEAAWRTTYVCPHGRDEIIAQALIEAEKDTQRIEAWFGGKVQYDINVFMQGVREGWNVQVWREFIDAAMKEKA